MHSPARWKDDPDCGHLALDAFQTHYCTYIRAPRLLTLQKPLTDHPDERLAILALQAMELWLKVVANDVRAALAEMDNGEPPTHEPTKLLYRASELIRLLDRQCDLAESVLVHDLNLRIPVADRAEGLLSNQLSVLVRLTSELSHRIAPSDRQALSTHYAGLGYVGRFGAWSERYQRLLVQLFEPGTGQASEFARYLALDELLDLHQGVKGDWAPVGQVAEGLRATEDLNPDELMFIVVHQVFELWFRAMLHELDRILAVLLSDPPVVAEASRRMRRVVRTQQLLAEMIQIPTAMLPMDFFKFRSETRVVDGVTHERGLSPASGTESYQFRELEIVAGLKNSAAHQELLHGNPRMHTRFLTPAQANRLRQPSLPEAFARLLKLRGVDDVLALFRPADEPNPHADLAELADLLLEFDKFFQLWRVNHLTMVQSMIGRKSGTGFLGPEYLKETVGMGMQAEEDRLLRTPQIRPRFFEDLWEARTRMEGQGRAAPASGKPGEGDG
jgi:tryptophan 2,3-dioxygenase